MYATDDPEESPVSYPTEPGWQPPAAYPPQPPYGWQPQPDYAAQARAAAKRRRLWWIAGAVAAVVVVLAGAGAFLLLRGTGALGGDTFTVRGSLTVSGFYPGGPGGVCDGTVTDGFNDITAGAQVVIYDHTNNVVGTGALQEGSIVPLNHDFNVCKMAFTVPAVPAGKGPYWVEVTHRGRIQFTEAGAGDVELSLS